MKNVLGVLLIVVALVLAIAPVFTDCESHGKTLQTADGRSVSMKCHWTGIAEIAPGVFMAAAGLGAILARRRETVRFAAILGVLSGALALLLPTELIGTCGAATMVCNLLMRPILLIAGIVGLVASTALFFVARDAESTKGEVSA